MKRIWKLQYEFGKKQHMCCFFLFGFINVIIFIINPCGPYSGFVGAGSGIKVCFGLFGSIRTTYDQLLT